MTITEFLARLDHVRKSGAGWTARCPAHEDRANSLSITEKEGKILLHCFARCGFDAICDAAGIEQKEMFSPGPLPQSKPAPEAKAELLREHIYTLADGTPVARKLRWGSPDQAKDKKLKRFSWQRWSENGWKNGLEARQQTSLPLYHLPDLLHSNPGDSIVLTEGEHDADAGKSLGFITTSTGGIGTFSAERLSPFRDRKVAIFSHPKPQERAEAEKRAALLYSTAAEIRIVCVPGFKDLGEAAEAGVPKNIIDALIADAKVWAPATGADLLDDVERMIARYVRMEPASRAVIALWIAHTYVVEANHFTPYLYITSPERACGKSTLLDLLEMLASNPMLTGSISPSALYRAIEKWKPTLLIDEIENLLSGDQNQDSDLLGVLNSGFKKGTPAIRNVGLGAQMEPARFETFGAKAFAGIGAVKDTILSRSLIITLKRAMPNEVEVLEYDEAHQAAAQLAAKLAAWIQPQLSDLAHSSPSVPEELTGRERNISKPLLAIADVAGQSWPAKARQAIAELCSTSRRAESSRATLLLEHLRLKFAREDGTFAEFIPTPELLEFLTSRDEWPWAERGKSKKPLTGPGMAYLLKNFGIKPVHKHEGTITVRGYTSADFIDSWERYCCAESVPSPVPTL